MAMNTFESNTKTNVNLVSICMQMGLQGGERVVFMLVGEPGIAKTKGVEAIARRLNEALGKPFACEIWSGPQIQAEDAAGLPVPDLKNMVTHLLPLRIGKDVTDAGAGVLCIDEFGSLQPSQEAAFLNLLQGGRLGEKVLPNEVAMGGMMNPEDAGAAAGRALSAAAANRLVWVPWTLDPHAWYDYMLGGKGLSTEVKVLPKDWESNYLHVASSLIVSYMRKNPGQLQQMPPEHDASKAWPSPRSWETAARLLAAVMSTGESEKSDLANLAVSGCVGAAAEPFMQWLIHLELPDPEEVLKNPKNASKLLPEREDHLSVSLEAVAVAACQERDDRRQRWETAWEIIVPIFVAKHDVGMDAAKTLAKIMHIPELKGAKRPPEARKVFDILKESGLMT